MYKLDLVDGLKFLTVTVHGIQDLKTDAEIDIEIATECAKRGATAVLIDIRPLKGRLSIIDNHLAAKTLWQRMPISITNIAIVDYSANKAENDMYQLTASNRSKNVKFFSCIEEAENWLAPKNRLRSASS